MRAYQFPRLNRHQLPPMPGVRGMVGGVRGTPMDALDVSDFPALDTSYQSPYNIPYFHKLPPSWVTGDVAQAPDGHTIIGINVAPLSKDAAQRATLPQQKAPKGPYGDMVTLRFALAALGSRKVLNRPTFKRILLQIQNRDQVNDINYNFGAPATALTFGIPAGGSSSFLDACPQNELWLFSTAGANVVIGYIDSMTPDAPSEVLE